MPQHKEPKKFGVILSRAYRLVRHDYDVRRRLGGQRVSLTSEIIAASKSPTSVPTIRARLGIARLARTLRAKLREEIGHASE